MDVKDWTQHRDFDDLSRDLTAGDFKSSLLEMRFSQQKAEQKKEQDGRPPSAS